MFLTKKRMTYTIFCADVQIKNNLIMSDKVLNKIIV